MITNMWYRKSEQAARLGIWCVVFLFAFLPAYRLINFGLGSAGGPSAWKYLYYFVRPFFSLNFLLLSL
jgi:hypothetical protein